MKLRPIAAALLAAGALALGSQSVGAQPRHPGPPGPLAVPDNGPWIRGPRMAPPPMRAEHVPHARRGHVWAPGYWRWNGHRYVWIAGHWERERRGYRWDPPHWEQRPDGWYFRGGRWVR